jgi:Tfp pilus assembly protein FimT
MIELVVVVAIAGIIMAVGVPTLWSYWRTSTLNAGAEELAAVLNRGRQLAIKENTSVCVTSNNTTLSYFLGCGVTAWTGEGTDGAGVVRLQNSVTVSNTVTVTFTYLGAAAPGGTFRVRNPIDATTLFVCVATTGRVRVQASTVATPSSTCP